MKDVRRDQMDYETCTAMCKALSDETRLKIVDMLSCGELCACELLEHLEVTQPTLSYHMKTLTGCGLVQSEKRGSWAYYHLDDALFAELCSYIGQLSTYKEDCICKSGGCGYSDAGTGNDESEEKR